MSIIHNQEHLKPTRRELRNNFTPAEAALWCCLRGKKLAGRKFRRQHSIGNYIVDFYCPQEKLAIELDGAGHFTSTGIEMDQDRENYLETLNIRVLRFENKEVFLDLDGVLDRIRSYFTIPSKEESAKMNVLEIK